MTMMMMMMMMTMAMVMPMLMMTMRVMVGACAQITRLTKALAQAWQRQGHNLTTSDECVF
jgi:hypothetical protein